MSFSNGFDTIHVMFTDVDRGLGMPFLGKSVFVEYS